MKPLFFLTLLGIWSSPAVAEEVARVVVVSAEPANSTTEAEVLWSARRALLGVQGLEVIDGVELLSDGATEATDLGSAQAALAAGEEAFAALELDAAAVAWLRAAKLFLHHRRRYPEAGRPLEEALVGLARAKLAAKDRRGALEALVWLWCVSPDHRVDAASATPSFLSALREAKGKVPQGTGSVVLESRATAALFLDGQFVGVGRATVSAAAGPHVVAADGDGFVRAVSLVEVAAGREAALRLDLEPAHKADLWRQVQRRVADEAGNERGGTGLKDLKALFAADQAVVIEQSPYEVVGHLYDLRLLRRVRTVQLLWTEPVATGARVARDLYQGLDPLRPGLTAPPEEASPDKASVTSSWWFWSAVGVGVVAAVVVPVLVLRPEEPEGLARRREAGALILRF